MSYHHPITVDEVRNNVQERIAQTEAELQALKGVTINTKHKTLTNRAIDGPGARIGDYIGIDKALYVSYYADESATGGSSRHYMSRDITAYTYNNPDGSEIGVDGCMRISRTMTPAELNDVLQSIIAGLANNLTALRREKMRAETIAKQHNRLVDQLKKFNDSVSYASKAQI